VPFFLWRHHFSGATGLFGAMDITPGGGCGIDGPGRPGRQPGSQPGRRPLFLSSCLPARAALLNHSVDRCIGLHFLTRPVVPERITQELSPLCMIDALAFSVGAPFRTSNIT